MAYRRRQYRRSSGQRDKYSVEQTGFSVAFPEEATNGLYQSAVQVVAPDTTQGMRKVKHLTVNLTYNNGAGTEDAAELFWTLVFVPQGYTPNAMYSTTGTVSGSLYEPNQFVMNAGIVDPSAGPIRFRSPVSRNLNSGDSIYLIIGTTSRNPSAPTAGCFGVVRYAVTLQ
uniref:Capsid protein n=1 Tax=unidentified TaxID=32644 RepID=A0A6G9W2E8_9ZZZZ|nr:capsid protein [unidentified]